MTTVMIVDDEPSVVELLDFTLKTAGWDTMIARNAVEAWEILRAGPPPQLMLLDWVLPDQSGLTLLSRIRSDCRYQSLPVIMVTAKRQEDDKIAGLNNGADDYITKPFSPRELAARIRSLLRRKAPDGAETVLKFGPILLDTLNCLVSVDDQRIEIGQAEYKLLEFFMNHPERVFSRAQLLDKVWESRNVIEKRSVDVYILRLRQAMRGAKPLLKTVRRTGYILTEK
jgi:two-component system phosphate regulon response regulator PhoB